MYFPISRTCTGAFATKELGLRNKSYPFDWCGQSYKTVSYILDNGVDYLFDDYEISSNIDNFPPRIWDKHYNMLFFHEEEDNILDTKKKYLRRYNNLITDLKDSDYVVLVQSSTCERTLVSHFKEWEEYFMGKIPDKAIDDNSLDCVIESVLKINPNIKIQVTKHVVWEELLKELKTYA
tara:strand:- start:41 stop:577 length:537 start_codon:yes stop_codon:yes gene_type:complete